MTSFSFANISLWWEIKGSLGMAVFDQLLRESKTAMLQWKKKSGLLFSLHKLSLICEWMQISVELLNFVFCFLEHSSYKTKMQCESHLISKLRISWFWIFTLWIKPCNVNKNSIYFTFCFEIQEHLIFFNQKDQGWHYLL